jgi:hypothetical protein
MDFSRLDKESNIPAFVFKQNSFLLCPEHYTYQRLDAFCANNNIDRSSWRSVYLGLLTLKTFGASALPALLDMPFAESVMSPDNNAPMSSPLFLTREQPLPDFNGMNSCEYECLSAGLTIVQLECGTFEVYDRTYNWLGDISELGGSFWDERFQEYKTIHKAALAISKSYAGAWFG